MSGKWPYWMLVLALTAFLIPLGTSGQMDNDVESVYQSTRIFDSTRPISKGLGIGDPDNDGSNEILFTDFDGNVLKLEIASEGELFPSSVIWTEAGPPGGGKALLDLEIGDVIEDNDGDEIIVGGDTGRLTAIYMSGGEWLSSTLYEGEQRIFDIKIADIDPAPGMEILFVSNIMDQQNSDPYVRYIYRDGTDWSLEEIEIFDTANVVEVGECDPDIEGNEIWVTTNGFSDRGTNSSLLCVKRAGNGWDYDIIYNNPTTLISNVNIGNLYSANGADDIMISEMNGWCKVLWKDTTSFNRINVFKAETDTGSPSALEASAIGEFNPLTEGMEAVVTGYYNKVTEVKESEDGLVAHLAWQTPLEDLRLEITGAQVGDVSDSFSGNEIIISSLQGWVEMIYFRENYVVVNTPQDFVEVEEGSSQTFKVGITPLGSISGTADLEISSPGELNLQYPDTITLEEGETKDIEILMNADTTALGARFEQLDVTVTIGDVEASSIVDVRVVESEIGLSLAFDPPMGNIIPFVGDSITTKVSLINGNQFDEIEIQALPAAGLDVQIDDTISSGEEKTMTLTATEGLIPGQVNIALNLMENGVKLGMGIFPVNVMALREAVSVDVREVDDEITIEIAVNTNYPIDNLDVDIMADGITIEETNFDPEPFETREIKVEPKDVSGRNVSVSVSSGGLEFTRDLGLQDVIVTEDEDEQTDTTIIVIFIIVVILMAAVIIFLYVNNNKMRRECEPEDRNTDMRSFETRRRK